MCRTTFIKFSTFYSGLHVDNGWLTNINLECDPFHPYPSLYFCLTTFDHLSIISNRCFIIQISKSFLKAILKIKQAYITYSLPQSKLIYMWDICLSFLDTSQLPFSCQQPSTHYSIGYGFRMWSYSASHVVVLLLHIFLFFLFEWMNNVWAVFGYKVYVLNVLDFEIN